MWYIVSPAAMARSTSGRSDGDETTPMQMPAGGEVSCRVTCMGEPPLDPLGGDHCAGPWQRTGTVGEGLTKWEHAIDMKSL